MAHKAKEMKFLATPEKGEVSALLVRPGDASHLLVLGHGASTNMRHATLQTIAERLADAGIATFRYNFPYMEHGRGRDSQEVCTATVRSAVAAAHRAALDLPLLAGGHSFGGRIPPRQPQNPPSMAYTAWFSSPSPCISPASQNRSARTTSARSRSRCSYSAARATSWRTWNFCNPSARNSANARHFTPWTLPTTASAPSNAPARARRMYSSRWLASSGSGCPG